MLKARVLRVLPADTDGYRNASERWSCCDFRNNLALK